MAFWYEGKKERKTRCTNQWQAICLSTPNAKVQLQNFSFEFESKEAELQLIKNYKENYGIEKNLK